MDPNLGRQQSPNKLEASMKFDSKPPSNILYLPWNGNERTSRLSSQPRPSRSMIFSSPSIFPPREGTFHRGLVTRSNFDGREHLAIHLETGPSDAPLPLAGATDRIESSCPISRSPANEFHLVRGCENDSRVPVFTCRVIF